MSLPSITTPPCAPIARWRRHHDFADRLMGRHARGSQGNVALPNTLRHILTIQQHEVAVGLRVKSNYGIVGETSQRNRFIQVNLMLERFERQRPVHGATFQIDVSKLLGQPRGDGALSRSLQDRQLR